MLHIKFCFPLPKQISYPSKLKSFNAHVCHRNGLPSFCKIRGLYSTCFKILLKFMGLTIIASDSRHRKGGRRIILFLFLFLLLLLPRSSGRRKLILKYNLLIIICSKLLQWKGERGGSVKSFRIPQESGLLVVLSIDKNKRIAVSAALMSTGQHSRSQA